MEIHVSAATRKATGPVNARMIETSLVINASNVVKLVTGPPIAVIID